MKTLPNIVTIMALAFFVIAAQPTFAQQTTSQQEQQKFRIKIVKDDNGKQEVTDKTFNSKSELEAYVNENKIDAPEMNELPEIVANAKCTNTQVKCDDSKMKKIAISETNTGNVDGSTTLSITYNNFSPEERAQVIQNIINQKGTNVRLEIRKEREVNSAKNDESNQPAYSVNELSETANNLTDVKVFPNPANGQFHIAFNVGKASNVQLRLTDLNGKEIYAENFNNYSGKFEKNINNTNLSAGTYIMNVQAGNEKTTTKVVMQ